MADSKISALPAATTLTGAELMVVVQGGVTKQSTVSAAQQINGYSRPFTLVSCGIPFVIPSSGTMGNNGALSAIAAVRAAYTSAYVYMEANVIASGVPAGWYYAVFSSTSAATLYNNVYATVVPSVPASPTAFVTTGVGAYTRTATISALAIQVTILANTLGVSGFIDVSATTSQTNNGNGKSIGIGMDGNNIITSQIFSVANVVLTGKIAACGVTNKQVGSAISSAGAGYISEAINRTYDMTTNRTFNTIMTTFAATDTIVQESFTANISP
jgi:hypothetical protein